MKQTCARPGCRRPHRATNRYCAACAREATRRWRAQPAVQAREQARIFTPEERAVRAARAYVAEYVKRGKLARGRCELCNESETAAIWDDPSKPLAVRWRCRDHRSERREDQRAIAQAQAALQGEFATLRMAVAALPPEVRANLHTIALLGLAGEGCEAGSLRYWLTLRREIARHTPITPL